MQLEKEVVIIVLGNVVGFLRMSFLSSVLWFLHVSVQFCGSLDLNEAKKSWQECRNNEAKVLAGFQVVATFLKTYSQMFIFFAFSDGRGEQ